MTDEARKRARQEELRRPDMKALAERLIMCDQPCPEAAELRETGSLAELKLLCETCTKELP